MGRRLKVKSIFSFSSDKGAHFLLFDLNKNNKPTETIKII